MEGSNCSKNFLFKVLCIYNCVLLPWSVKVMNKKICVFHTNFINTWSWSTWSISTIRKSISTWSAIWKFSTYKVLLTSNFVWHVFSQCYDVEKDAYCITILCFKCFIFCVKHTFQNFSDQDQNLFFICGKISA